MIPSASVLPRSLQHVATNDGLVYPTRLGGELAPYPIATKALPVFKDPIQAVAMMPLQMNFAYEVLDMDRQEDREEYNRIMNYWQAGYGMQILHHERKFVRKKRKGKQKVVQRIFIEYFAPYRILTNADDS